MRIITLSGLDGSGKSTQIKLLENYLKSKNKKVFYFHIIDYSLANKILFWKHHHNKKTDTGLIQSKTWQIFLRKIILKIDYWRFKFLIQRLRLYGYDYILSDRFFYDSFINLAYLKKNQNLFLSKISLTHLISFYLKTSPDIIMQRSRQPQQGLKYLQTKKKLYDSFFKKLPSVHIIDGNQSTEKVFEEIIKRINPNSNL